ncbi:MAG TPA: hypothetical protein VMT53_23975, partial [Terriglobales bacterium]|nr:hypothetical protein [Terriglobales bacterium]
RLHTPPRACAADHPSKVVALTGFAEIATPNLPQINQPGYNYSGTELGRAEGSLATDSQAGGYAALPHLLLAIHLATRLRADGVADEWLTQLLGRETPKP